MGLSGREPASAINAKSSQQWFIDAPVANQSMELAPDARGYTYDPIGNRKTATGWDQSAQVQTSTTYTPNALNQYAAVNGAALLFDLDGNLSEDAARIYTYDGENRLLTVEPKVPAEGDRKAAFAYDYLGRRVKKESYARQSSAWVKTDETRYLYDGWNMIRELNASGQTKKSYVWGIDLSGTLQGAGGIGGLVASVEPSTGTHAHYFFDGNGNVTQAVDAATGAPLAHYEYDPFGNVTYSHGPMAASNPYRFSTKYHDDETALVYYGYRYYSPALGRWVNRDPIGDIAFSLNANGNPSGLNNYELANLYALTFNSPTNFVDLLGLRTKFAGEILFEFHLVGGGGVGFAVAETDCVNGEKHVSTYLAIPTGFSIGADLLFGEYAEALEILERVNIFSQGLASLIEPDFEFEIPDDVPPFYYSFFNVKGPSAGFIKAYGLGNVDASMFDGFKGTSESLMVETDGKIGVDIATFDAIHLIEIKSETAKCCQ